MSKHIVQNMESGLLFLNKGNELTYLLISKEKLLIKFAIIRSSKIVERVWFTQWNTTSIKRGSFILITDIFKDLVNELE